MHWRGVLIAILLLLLSSNVRAADDLVHQYDRSRCPINALFDKEGAALVDYGAPLGRRHNPVTVSQYAIACERSFRPRRKPVFWKIFTAQIRYLQKHAITRAPDMAYYEYDFPWSGYGLAPGWQSGLAQGLAISALIRYYRYTGDKDVFALIPKLKSHMLAPISAGGVAAISPEGKFWIEEFPSDPPSFVLNGFISAVFGLYEYTRLFPKDSAAHQKLIEALTSVKASLPAYDAGDWTLLDRRAPPYPRANDNYMPVYIKQLQTLAEITGDPFFSDMSLRWRSFFDDVHVHWPGNTERMADGVYRVKPELPVVFPTNALRDNVERIDSTPSYEGFAAGSLLFPVGDGHTDYQSYFAPREDGPAFIQIRLKRSAAVNTLVLGLYNVELYPLDLRILVRDDTGPWRSVAYDRGSDRRHFAYYFAKTRIREIRLEATQFHGQNRLILSEMMLGSTPPPKPIRPNFGSFLSAPVALTGRNFSVRLEAPSGPQREIVAMYRHARDPALLEGSLWELDFIDPLRPNEQPVRDRFYQFRILSTGAQLATGWTRPVVVEDEKPMELQPVSSQPAAATGS